MQCIMEHQLGARRGNTTAGHRDVVVRRMARQELVTAGHTCESLSSPTATSASEVGRRHVFPAVKDGGRKEFPR